MISDIKRWYYAPLSLTSHIKRKYMLWQFSNKHHHWVRDNSWVQIIIIKVIYSLAREDLLVSNNTHELSQWGKTERDKRKQLSVGFIVPSRSRLSFSPSLQGEMSVHSPLNVLNREKGRQMPPWWPFNHLLFLTSFLVNHTKNAFLTMSKRTIYCIHLEYMFH